MFRKFFTREQAGREMAPAETIHSEVNASASPGAELFVARETAIDAALVEEMLRMIANVGTGLWRMRQKMVNPDTNEPHEEMRRIYRNFESVWDSIDQAEVQIQDHTGNLYKSGTTLRVIAFQPTVD